MKKLISLLLVVFMLFSLATVAFAEGEGAADPNHEISGDINNVKGVITINGASFDENGAPVATYKIYQILKLQSYDTTGAGSYHYVYTGTAGDVWYDFFNGGAGKDYVAPNDDGVLVWMGANSAERVASFAKLALEYAQKKGINPTRTTTDPTHYTKDVEKGSVSFGDLELGYYLVDTSVGALCGLSTTAPLGIINGKNGIPTLVKRVQEDLDKSWGSNSTLDIGQDANFQIEVTVHAGAQNYQLVDTMEDSLTFKEDTLKVKVRTGGADSELKDIAPTTEVTGEGGQTETRTNYVLKADSDKHGFVVEFTQDFCDTLNSNDRLIVEYSAMLNRDAEIGNSTQEVVNSDGTVTPANPANENKAYLGFGDVVGEGRAHKTEEASVTVTTYGFDLTKTDGQNKLLEGASFKIYDAATGGNEITFVPLKEDDDTTDVLYNDKYHMYRKARANETGEVIVVTDGLVRIVGLDNGVYYLEEVDTPEGYTPINGRQAFTISEDNVYAAITNNIVSVGSGVQVVNYTGSILPETGGLGTLLFTVLGGSTVLGSGVVLVTKKRMSKIVDED